MFSYVRLFITGNNKTTSITTNVDGEFNTQLSPGRYEITVERIVSNKFTAFIEIRENGINPNDVEFITETNPICCGEFPDKIYPKILSLPKPPYPIAARVARAVGRVDVSVKIDKQGRVTSAKAESGHPLLRTASEQAASQSLFETSENAIEREAKLTFVFLGSGKNLKHYSNRYRTEIFNDFVVINKSN